MVLALLPQPFEYAIHMRILGLKLVAQIWHNKVVLKMSKLNHRDQSEMERIFNCIYGSRVVK